MHTGGKSSTRPTKYLSPSLQVPGANGIIASLLSPLETSIAISPNQNGTFHKPCLKFGLDTEPTHLPAYSTILKEYADKNSILLRYVDTQTQFQPPMFTCKVTLGEREAIGLERSSKKDAKHEASKALWNLP
jgi:hypothetical protein